MLEPAEGRVLICGSRRWPWPSAVGAVLDRLLARHGDRLVVIEGSATGADAAACSWCRRHGLDADRHRSQFGVLQQRHQEQGHRRHCLAHEQKPRNRQTDHVQRDSHGNQDQADPEERC
ncbi:SLOG family protein [Streptomyces paradoxus]|uniref:YspA cpYpsA-related SLOG domain-containing protein n=1 Tax=Streptomyces paradoxus TaxID=66375 RepID=A0A7W9TJJ8_9ACTN|nr:SLOG family protein [Streptomyces paradoxus]MBB6081893.1 hypothetical protein [Streptomyces paradoxus]